MAIPFLNNITLNNNEIQNVRLQNGGNPPLNSGPGQIYFDSTQSPSIIDTAKYYANSTDTWVSLKEYSFPTGTYVTGTVTGTTPKPIITFDLNAENGTAAVGERYLTKNNKWAEVASIPGTYTFNVAADSGTPETINDGDTLSIAGGTYITTAVGAADTVTINHDNTSRTDTNSTDTPGYGQTFEAVTSVTTNATGHVTAIDVSTVTIPASDDTTYDLEGVGSTNGTAGVRLSGSDATNDDVLIVGAGTTTVTRSNNTLTVTSNDQFTGTVTSITAGVGLNGGTITTSGTIALDYNGSDNYIINNPNGADTIDSFSKINFHDDDDENVYHTELGEIPVSALTLVKNYIDNSVSGGVYYQGGYDPTTDLTSPGNYGLQTPPNPNIIEIGWMYTVTADGTFFGEQVRIGDVLIAEVDAPTALADWTTVQNNIDFATAGTDTGAGAAIVGISRYDEDDFTVSSTGFVQLTVPAARSGSIAVPNSTTYTYPNNITAGSTNNVLIQLVDGDTGETVYADVTRLNTTTFSVDYGVTTPTGVIALIQLIG